MKKVKITYIPKQYQQGGKTLTNSQMLTGNYQENSNNPTVEVEDGEFTKNSQTGAVKEVVGKKHTQGGEKINLPDQSKVLSDYTKVGATHAKTLGEMFDIKVKASDTFATVLDKYNSKIGIKKTEEEEKELLEKFEKNSESKIDQTTKQINEDFLAKEIQDINKKKEALNKLKAEAFEFIFQIQETVPKKGNGQEILDKNGKPIKQDGGIVDERIQALAVQYGMQPEEILQILEQGGNKQQYTSYQEGGEAQNQDQVSQIIQAYAQATGANPQQIVQQLQQMQPEQQQAAIQQMVQQLQQSQGEEQVEGQMSNPQEEAVEMQQGGQLPIHQEVGVVNQRDPIRDIINPYYDPAKMILQHSAGDLGYGQLLTNQPYKTTAEMQRVLPSLYNQYLLGKTANQVTPEVVGAYQKGYNAHLDQIKEDAKKVYGEDSEQYKGLLDKIEANKFTPLDIKEGKNTNVRGLDSKLGDYTATRPNFALSVIPREELLVLNNAGINTASQLKEKNPELFKKYVGDKNLTSDFWLGAIDPQKGETPTTPAGVIPTEQKKATKGSGVKNVLYDKGMPYIIPPSAPIAPYLQQINLSRLEGQKGSVENQLQASENARQAAMAATRGLPPAQAAAIMANYLATSGQQDTQGIAAQELQDLQNKARIEQYNASQADKEAILNEQLKKAYEREAFGTLNVNEQSWRNYYDTQEANKRTIASDIDKLNAYNAMLEHNQLTGRGIEFVNQSPFYTQIGASSMGMTPQEQAVYDKALKTSKGNKDKAMADMYAYRAKSSI